VNLIILRTVGEKRFNGFRNIIFRQKVWIDVVKGAEQFYVAIKRKVTLGDCRNRKEQQQYGSKPFQLDNPKGFKILTGFILKRQPIFNFK
jgi:hypothetical protein